MKNYYEILEVNKTASKEIIENAYKILEQKNNPDLFQGEQKQLAQAKIKDITEAYNILSNDFLREQYDAELEKQKNKNTKDNQSNYKPQNSYKPHKVQQKKKEEPIKENKVGTLDSIIDIVKNLAQLVKNREKREKAKEVTKKDIIALLLTIVVVALIGVALWFIPFTNGWMRELLFENPLFSWIGGLFS